jgi:hypothetical protein
MVVLLIMEEILRQHAYFYYMESDTFNLKKVYTNALTPVLLQMIHDQKMRVFVENKNGDIDCIQKVQYYPRIEFGC